MSFEFRPAVRSDVSLLLSLAGGTGSGKTFSSLRIAKGLAEGKRFAVLDSENGRASYYADKFAFDVVDLRAPFRPDTYGGAIKAADDAKYPVIVVDSFSHSYAGEGGILDWSDEELDKMAGSDWKKREACKMASWIKPKQSMKKLVQQLLQVRAHIIFCLRAEPKIEMVRGENGKMEIRAKQSLTGLDGWIPICDKNFPFEMTASFLLMADAPGVPKPIKLMEQHRSIFPAGQPITEECGVKLLAWAKGGTAPRVLDDDPTAVDRLTFAINACESTIALKIVAEQVKALPKSKQELLRAVYAAKSTALKAEESEVREPGSDDA